MTKRMTSGLFDFVVLFNRGLRPLANDDGPVVSIVELDIKCMDMDVQADLYRFIFQKYLEIVSTTQRGGNTVWGINDKDSWVGENNAPAPVCRFRLHPQAPLPRRQEITTDCLIHFV